MSVLINTTVETAACTAGAWSDLAKAKLSETGFNLTYYNFKHFYVPDEAGGNTCDWG